MYLCTGRIWLCSVYCIIHYICMYVFMYVCIYVQEEEEEWERQAEGAGRAEVGWRGGGDGEWRRRCQGSEQSL